MFAIARWIVRHKVGTVAIVALGVVMLSPNENEAEKTSTNPWSTEAQAHSQVAAADDMDFLGKLKSEAADLAEQAGFGEVAGEATQTAARFEQAADVMSKAND